MSVMCCGEADESNGAEHAVWCQSYDLAKAVAAARREGWAQAVEALRDEALWRSRRGTMSHPPHSMAVWMADYLDSIDRPEYPLASNFTDRAAALTEEAGQ